jgi:uncharacterized protein YdaU (DUF1376 family)
MSLLILQSDQPNPPNMKTHDTTLQQLRDAIISMKPERLQKILPLMCEERPECVPIFVNYFLVNEKPNPNKRLKKEVCVKNEDDGIKKEEDIDAEEVKDHRGQATDAVVSESESSEESAADDRPKEYAGQRWEECRRCGEDYDVTRNSHGICKWHDGNSTHR